MSTFEAELLAPDHEIATQIATLVHESYDYLGSENPVFDIDETAAHVYDLQRADKGISYIGVKDRSAHNHAKLLGVAKLGPWLYGDEAPFVRVPHKMPGRSALQKVAAKAWLHAYPADGLHELAVTGDARGDGIGQTLLERVEQQTRADAVKVAVLEHEANEWLGEWLDRQNYRKTNRIGDVALSAPKLNQDGTVEKPAIILPHRLHVGYQ